jgi:predicted DCC family thiol-disulfide oxidoreductase YuxK
MNTPIVFFDGVCNLCNGAVQFIIARDSAARLRFASLQSETCERILEKNNFKNIDLKTIILLENNNLYDRSTAALRIARHMDGFWRLLYVFIIVPRPIRDVVYDWIARNRYRWFGKKATCWLPTPELKKRFETENYG